MMSVQSMPPTLALNNDHVEVEDVIKPEAEMVTEPQNFGGTQKLSSTLTNMLGSQETQTRQ